MTSSHPKLTLEDLRKRFDFYREGNGFSSEVSYPIWLGYTFATKGEADYDVVDLMRALRNWYEPWFERVSIISLMGSLKGNAELYNMVAYGIWRLHTEGCPSKGECSLHSLGALWTAGRMDGDCDPTGWFAEAISDLLQSHPLRAWARSIPSQCARDLSKGWLTASDVVHIMATSIECGTHEYWVDHTQLNETWRLILDHCNEVERAKMIAVGNRMVAAGLTSIIDIQLKHTKT